MARRPEQEAAIETAAVVVEICRNFHINAPTDVPDRTVRQHFLAGDKHVVDKATAKLWTDQGHAKVIDAD